MKHCLAVLLAAACGACSGSGSPGIDLCSAATSNFSLRGSRFPEAVELQWAGSPDASYEVWGFGPKHEDEFENPIVKVTGTSATIGIPANLGTVQVEVRPVVGKAACPTTAEALTVPVPPTLTAAATASGVQLQWSADPLYGPNALIGRGPEANTLETLASASGGHYLDSSVASGTAYDYVVELHATNLDGFSDPVTAHTLVGAPVVSATARATFIVVSWQNPVGASSCTVVRDSPAPATVQATVSGTGATASCPALTSCTYRVFCTDAFGQDGPPGFTTARLAPAPPASCSLTSMVGGVRIDWSGASPDTAFFSVQRSTDGGNTFQPAGTTAASPYFDSAAPLFQKAQYRVFSAGADGTFDPLAFCATPAPAMAVNAPDAMNLAASTGTIGDEKTPGQTFTVKTGGQLAGIELARPQDTPNCLFVSSSGDPQADIAPACADETRLFVSSGSTLSPDRLQGVYYDLSSQHLAVSAGETLRFQIDSDLPAGAVASSDSAGGGGATLFGGSPDPAHDLLFKVFVLPSNDLTAPQLHAFAGPSAALLDWTASPGATGYDVLDAAGSVLLQTADTHATVAIDTAGATFAVRANGASGSLVSDSITVHATGLVPDAANLCNSIRGYSANFLGFPAPISQTFTTVNAGLLARVELVLTNNAPMLVDIEDLQGNWLAFGSVFAPFQSNAAPYRFPPLSTVVPSAVSVDLSASGAHVTPGQALRLVLHADLSVVDMNLIYRDSDDAYSGGDEAGTTAPRDLCFQLYVDPSR